MRAEGRRNKEQFDIDHTDRFIKGIRIDWDSELYYERYGAGPFTSSPTEKAFFP
ncbi:hypothetical protein AAAU98_16930 [Enterocloster citroniae]|uniref:hypothetical protein n=1 Tax=Enterocloster citroniae TaxID=358743 RepID=UPI0032BFD1BF